MKITHNLGMLYIKHIIVHADAQKQIPAVEYKRKRWHQSEDRKHLLHNS